MPIEMATFRKSFQAICAGTLLFISHFDAAFAATLQVSPILIQFYKGTQAQPVWLTNEGETPLRAQVRVYRWTQVDNDDRLEITNDVVASPPVMEVDAGKRQLLRIVRRNLASVTEEESYRIIVDELPIAETPSSEMSNGLTFLLRYSIPAFISPTAEPKMHLESEVVGEVLLNPPRVQIINNGKSRVRVARLTHETKDGKTASLIEGLVGYVLQKNQRTWDLPSSITLLPPGVLKMKITNDSGEKILQMELPQK